MRKYERNMTDAEKAVHPTYETTGDYLTECGQLWWNQLSTTQKEIVKSIDAEIFFQCTGIRVESEEK
nr:MAG TPA: hypothetical protein [Caudoviricetes sp.]